ncbi:MAG TPA: hypothetical protein VIG50_05525 [Vicinamibacteria bacterium]
MSGAPTTPAMTALNRFLPAFDIRERHRVRVRAPVEATYAAAVALDLGRSRMVRAIFRARALAMRAKGDPALPAGTLLDVTQGMGWRVLAERPGREIVLGAVTRPWDADVRFRGLPPDEFTAFAEPGYVKIAWALAADPLLRGDSLAATETRAHATDAAARRRFRRYWLLAKPGIVLIRHLALRLVRADAERRARP